MHSIQITKQDYNKELKKARGREYSYLTTTIHPDRVGENYLQLLFTNKGKDVCESTPTHKKKKKKKQEYM
jgi:hypothetical protein